MRGRINKQRELVNMIASVIRGRRERGGRRKPERNGRGKVLVIDAFTTRLQKRKQKRIIATREWCTCVCVCVCVCMCVCVQS